MKLKISFFNRINKLIRIEFVTFFKRLWLSIQWFARIGYSFYKICKLNRFLVRWQKYKILSYLIFIYSIAVEENFLKEWMQKLEISGFAKARVTHHRLILLFGLIFLISTGNWLEGTIHFGSIWNGHFRSLPSGFKITTCLVFSLEIILELNSIKFSRIFQSESIIFWLAKIQNPFRIM